jgi:hypothetical protein
MVTEVTLATGTPSATRRSGAIESLEGATLRVDKNHSPFFSSLFTELPRQAPSLGGCPRARRRGN